MFGLGFWRDLNAPDSFARDWYGELTNQLSHTFLGLMLALFWCVSAWAMFGEMPVRSWVILGIGAGYLAWEALVQRWLSGDSWFDAAMVMSGAAGVLLPLKEAGVSGRIIHLDFDPVMWLAVFAPWSSALSLRVWRRYLASAATQTD